MLTTRSKYTRSSFYWREAKEKLDDVETAVRNMFGLGHPFGYMNVEKKTPLWLFGKTASELKEIHEALKKRIASLETENGETEARLRRLVPKTLVGYSIPFCVDDYDSDIDYSFYEHIGKFRGKNSGSQVGILMECLEVLRFAGIPKVSSCERNLRW